MTVLHIYFKVGLTLKVSCNFTSLEHFDRIRLEKYSAVVALLIILYEYGGSMTKIYAMLLLDVYVDLPLSRVHSGYT